MNAKDVNRCVCVWMRASTRDAERLLLERYIAAAALKRQSVDHLTTSQPASQSVDGWTSMYDIQISYMQISLCNKVAELKELAKLGNKKEIVQD